MIEVRLAPRSMLRTIVQFDGHVIEFFFDELRGGSRRVHLGHIKTIELALVARGKEKYSLTVQCEYQMIAVDVSEEAFQRATDVVAAVRAAMEALSV